MRPILGTDDALQKAILAAHAGWSGGLGERFPVPGTLQPTGTAKDKQYQRGPGVPAVPVQNSIGWSATASSETNARADAWATWVERAAIREYDGAMSRAEAEVLTALELGPCPREPG